MKPVPKMPDQQTSPHTHRGKVIWKTVHTASYISIIPMNILQSVKEELARCIYTSTPLTHLPSLTLGFLLYRTKQLLPWGNVYILRSTCQDNLSNRKDTQGPESVGMFLKEKTRVQSCVKGVMGEETQRRQKKESTANFW